MSKLLSFALSQVPSNLGGARLGDSFLFFDNFSDDNPSYPPKPAFPVKCESMVVFTLLKGYMKMRINLQEITVQGGQALVLMPGCIFQTLEYSDDLRFFCFMMEAEIIDLIQKRFNVHVDLTHRYYNFGIHSLSESSMAVSLEMYRLIKSELAEPDYEYKKEVILRYCEIWILKSTSFSITGIEYTSDINKAMGRKEQVFREFLSLLEKHYTQNRSISFYASQLCLTPKYLSTIIKDVSGRNGMQWVDEYVVLEAKALLREGSLSVKQVSDRLNFPSQSMFGRFFKKMTGYTPKQYMLL